MWLVVLAHEDFDFLSGQDTPLPELSVLRIFVSLETHPESAPTETMFQSPDGFPKKKLGGLREKVLTKTYIYAIT